MKEFKFFEYYDSLTKPQKGFLKNQIIKKGYLTRFALNQRIQRRSIGAHLEILIAQMIEDGLYFNEKYFLPKY